MRWKAFTLVLMLMLPVALCSDGADTPFEGGAGEAIAVLSAPSFEDVVNVSLPADYRALSATMRVTGMASEGSSSAYPDEVKVSLDEMLLWAFDDPGQGPLGRQDEFALGVSEVKMEFGPGGGSGDAVTRLPKGAVVQSATVQLMGDPGSEVSPMLTLTGEASSWLGYSLASAGDVNGDGYDDMLVGVPYDDEGGANAGRALLFLGGSTMDDVADVVITGAADDMTGGRVSGAGDVDADGYDDVLVKTGGLDDGRITIYLGGLHMDDVGDLILTMNANDSAFGSSIGCAGDVNGDGYDDVIVGACDNNLVGLEAGRAYVYLGGPDMDNVTDVVLTAEGPHDEFGAEVAGTGDVNGDGYGDVLVGAPFNSAAGRYAGRAYLYYGGEDMDNVADVVFDGEAEDDNFGHAVSNAGDVNGDGFNDVLVGAGWNSAGGHWAGRTYIFFGGKGMDKVADVVMTGKAPDDNFGDPLSGAVDLNHDGYSDVLVGATKNDAGGTNAGRVYAYLGGPTMDNVADLVLTGEVARDEFGRSLSPAGDVNGDGNGEILVGTPLHYAAGACAGRAYLYSEGLLGPGLMIGERSVWNMSGHLWGTADTSDLALPLNDFLTTAPLSGTDDFGNSYVDVPLTGSAQDGGTLTLLNLSVVYSWNGTVPDFSLALNSYLKAHQGEAGPDGNITVPLKVRSRSAGRVMLSVLDLTRDMPPVMIEPIMPAALDEDTANLTLVDLHLHFQDDVDAVEGLTFSVVSATNSSFVHLFITDDRYVSVDAMAGEASDNWTGTVEAVVACADRWDQRTESDPFTITVRNVNDAPAITSLPPTAALARVPFHYNITAVDGDGDALRFSLTECPAGMTIDAGTGFLQWPLPEEGDHEVTVMVEDSDLSDRQSFVLSAVNRPPRITSMPPLNATVGVPYVYSVTAEDDNGDELAFSLASAVAGMGIGATDGAVQWTPPRAGRFVVSIKVSDGGSEAFQNFTVDVNGVPVFTSEAVTNATQGASYVYAAKAADEDGDRLSYSLVSSPEGMRIFPGSGVITWEPGSPGSFLVSIKASDGRGGEAVQEFTIEVDGVPRFTSQAVTQAIQGVPYVYAVEAVDDDGDRLDFSLDTGPEGMVVDAGTGKVTWTPGLPGNYRVVIRASDGRGGEALQEYTVVVATLVLPEVLVTYPSEGQTLTGRVLLSGTVTKGSRDVVGVDVSIDSGEWRHANGTIAWTLSLDAESLKAGTHTMRVRAFDGSDHSEVVTRGFVVERSSAKGEGMSTILVALMVILILAVAGVGAVLYLRRKQG